jgi:hypothetical protein
MSYRVSAAVAVLSALAMASPADAGLDKLHRQAVEGGRMCMTSHHHFMSSGTWPSKAQAMGVARRGWERFTAAEYGPRWGSLALAGGVDYGCAAGRSHRGATWSCNLKARPCRKL